MPEPKRVGNRAGSRFLEKRSCPCVSARRRGLAALLWARAESVAEASLLGMTPSPGPANQNLLLLAMLCHTLAVST